MGPRRRTAMLRPVIGPSPERERPGVRGCPPGRPVGWASRSISPGERSGPGTTISTCGPTCCGAARQRPPASPGTRRPPASASPPPRPAAGRRGRASVVVGVIVAMGVIELCGALRTQGYRPAGLVALLGSVGLVLGAYHSGEPAFAAVVALVAPATLLWYLAGVTRARPAPGVASTFLVFGYVGVMGAFAGLILGLRDGVGLLLGVVLCAVAYDISGYLAGRRF